jgi:hypothetical protein
MDIHSTAEFQAIIGEAVTNALHDVIDECERMVKQHVESDVYGTGGSDWYQRTNELLSAWQTVKGHLMAELSEDTGAISCNPFMWQHGSEIGGGTDVSDYILHMMNDGFNDVLNWGGGAPRPFWDNFIREFNSKGRSIVKRALRAQGLNVV